MTSRILAIWAVVLALLTASAARADTDPALVAWYEQAYAYYTAVMSGAEQKPPEAEWEAFIDQLTWAAEQLGYASGSASTKHTEEVTHLVFAGQNAVHDIWSNTITIDVGSTSAKVTVEVTTDTRVKPPETVLKIIVADPALGTASVYFVHDHADAKIDINVPAAAQVGGQVKVVKVGRLTVRKPRALAEKLRAKAAQAALRRRCPPKGPITPRCPKRP